MLTARRWFETRLDPLPHSAEAKAYVAGVFAGFIHSTDGVLAKESLVLAYAAAREIGSIPQHQRIGDWVLWAQTFAPDPRNVVVVESMGRLSYYACFKLLGGQWRLYEELADDLPRLTRMARKRLVAEKAQIPWQK